MKHIPDQEALSIKGNNGSPPPEDWSVRVVAHPNAKMLNWLVGNEGQTVRKHLVGRAHVRNNKAIQISRRDGPEERGNQIQREDDVITWCRRDGWQAAPDRPNGGSKWWNRLGQDARTQRDVVGNRPVRFIVDPLVIPIPSKFVRRTLVPAIVWLDCHR
jgi:hypothetical protein